MDPSEMEMLWRLPMDPRETEIMRFLVQTNWCRDKVDITMQGDQPGKRIKANHSKEALTSGANPSAMNIIGDIPPDAKCLIKQLCCQLWDAEMKEMEHHTNYGKEERHIAEELNLSGFWK